jgi:hypothetical protein
MNKSMQQAADTTAWWQPQTVPDGRTLDCRVGPLRLRVRHVGGEWRLVSEYEEEVPGPVAPVTLQPGSDELPDENIQRYIAPRGGEQLQLKPVLADRPVVIQPRQPVFLPSQTETTLYLSTPVWLQVEVGGGKLAMLCEIPTVRLSDTWFGSSTRVGELCYSGRTQARHDPAEVPYRSHRAITPVTIRNEAGSVLPLEKLSLPVPMLSVYGAEDGSLWTQRISLLRRSDSDMADIKVDAGAPAEAGTVSRISGPRRESGRGGIVRAFSVLFGN